MPRGSRVESKEFKRQIETNASWQQKKHYPQKQTISHGRGIPDFSHPSK